MPDVVTFDPDALRIVEISAGGDNVLSVQEIYSEWKAWLLADPSRMAYPQAFRYAGADPISDTQNLGTTFFLMNGWRIRPAELSHGLTLTGNLFTDPAGQKPVVATLGSFSVLTEYATSNLVDSVIVNSPDIQFNSFSGVVTVDPLSLFSGTAYPTGTPRQPVNNMADALAIATARGFETFVIMSDLTLETVNVAEKVFTGQNHNVVLTVAPSATVTDCGFNNLTLTGTLDGEAHIRDCYIGALTVVYGHITDSALQGTITTSGLGDLHIVNCYDGFAGSGTPTIDCGGSGSDLNVRGYRGGLALTNKTGAGDEVSIDLVGRLVLDATVTAGTIIVRGIGKVVVGGATATLDMAELVSPQTIDDKLSTVHGAGSWEGGGGLTAGAIADAVWDEAAADHVAAGSMGQLEGRLDVAVSSRATQAQILSDATPFQGARIDAAVSSRATQGQILSDATPFQGARIDASISSRAATGAAMTLTTGEEDAIVDKVWDEAAAGHNTAGSMGERANRLDASITSRAAPGAAMDLVNDAVDAGALATSAVSEITAAVDATLTAVHGAGSWQQGLTPTQATMLLEMYALLGLDPTKPLVVTATTRKVPADGSDIDQTISDVAGTVTVQRQ